MRARRNLRTYLIEPFKQIKIGVYVVGISFFFVMLAAFLISSAYVQQYQHLMEIFQVVDPTSQWELLTNDVFYRNAWKIGCLAIVYMLVLSAVSFRATHRIYGPLVAIERFVEQIEQGSYHKRVNIRQGDELKRLTEKLNHMASSLESRHGSKERRASKNDTA